MPCLSQYPLLESATAWISSASAGFTPVLSSKKIHGICVLGCLAFSLFNFMSVRFMEIVVRVCGFFFVALQYFIGVIIQFAMHVPGEVMGGFQRVAVN